MPTCIRTITKITWPSQSVRKQNTRDIPVLLISIWNTSSLNMYVKTYCNHIYVTASSTQHTLYLLTISSVLYKNIVKSQWTRISPRRTYTNIKSTGLPAWRRIRRGFWIYPFSRVERQTAKNDVLLSFRMNNLQVLVTSYHTPRIHCNVISKHVQLSFANLSAQLGYKDLTLTRGKLGWRDWSTDRNALGWRSWIFKLNTL